ncbi:MAG: ATP-binding cassette domain-containing protein [Candidatus Kapabacteria bacterium]|nr:ATP-binding cassette domain-containing protein [Candidatus Kapabacteria bacterium]
MTNDILQVHNAVKRFGDYTATDNISFSVRKGAIFGLLGPNGAGKTTLIRMITNILIPDSGEIRLFGEKVSAEQQNMIGYLPEERGLYKKMTVIDQIRYFGELKGLSARQATERGYQWLHRMGADGWEKKKIQELSKGMSQKVQFIATAVHNPPLLILDEPFSGFDPVNAELLISVIHELRNAGTTIILSTHVMEQVEKLCDDILLVNKGKVVLSGSVRDVKSQFGRDTVLIEFDGSDSFLDKLTGVKIISRTSHRAELRVDDTSQIQKILEHAMKNVTIYKYEVVEPSLNEIFITVVGGSQTNGGAQ